MHSIPVIPVTDDPPSPSKSERTRLKLCRAAEKIVAESGPGALTTRTVAKRANQRNTNAVIYHFGDVDTLLWNTIEMRAREMEGERARLLEQAINDGRTDDIATLFRCLGLPIISIVDEAGDHIFARFLIQLHANNHPYSFLLRETITPEFPARSALMALLLKRLDHLPADRLDYIVQALMLMPLHMVTAHDIARKAGKSSPPLEELYESSYQMLAAVAAADP